MKVFHFFYESGNHLNSTLIDQNNILLQEEAKCKLTDPHFCCHLLGDFNYYSPSFFFYFNINSRNLYFYFHFKGEASVF